MPRMTLSHFVGDSDTLQDRKRLQNYQPLNQEMTGLDNEKTPMGTEDNAPSPESSVLRIFSKFEVNTCLRFYSEMPY